MAGVCVSVCVGCRFVGSWFSLRSSCCLLTLYFQLGAQHEYIRISMPSPYSYIYKYMYLSLPFAQQSQLIKLRHVGWGAPVNRQTAAVAAQ